jgi:alpha-D-xyloside xylohydrolase
MPVHVRAGSILPVGPDIQYVGEKPSEALTLWIYAGADGSFTLYEDDGLSYAYEKGEYSRITMEWNEQEKTLHLGDREGSFPGMVKERDFHVILVEKDRSRPLDFDATPDHTLHYIGESLNLKL